MNDLNNEQKQAVASDSFAIVLDNLSLEAKFDEESVKKGARIKRNKLKKSQMSMF